MAKAQPAPSAHQVAALAGVSQAAVSRAFTEGASISDQTRSRVLAAAHTLGYRPNLLARSLITGKSGIVGVVVGNPRNPHCIEALNALSERLHLAGKHILIFTVEADCNVDLQVQDLLNYRVDALVIISAGFSAALMKNCEAADIPVIFLSRVKRLEKSATSIIGDNETGARVIAEHLIERGYRQLAYMVGYSDSWTNHIRREAFTEAIGRHGLPAPRSVIGHYDRDGAMKAARTLLASRQPPDAIFCASDHMACATIEVARFEFGLEIGRDIGIAGFDNVAQAAWPSFDLTSYSQPVEHMAGTVIELLDRPDATTPQHVTVPGALHVRGSTLRSPAQAPG